MKDKDKHWTPVDLRHHVPVSSRISWSESALECYKQDKRCEDCAIFNVVGRSWWDLEQSCKMPITVQKLLNKKIPLPTGERYFGGYHHE